MKQETAQRGRYCDFCGHDERVTATVAYGPRPPLKRRICLDCAAAAMRLLSSRAAGGNINKLAAV